ncbi:MAG: class II aldolase/adducin family protein [Ignavibacteriales bacterium]|nr:class II aldolase/adducin family protein [Ignavibacteriales bacterium]
MEPAPSRSDISRQLVNVCHLLYSKGFVTATDGNVSSRLPNGNILVTPSALNKGRVSESDLVEVMANGTPVTLSRRPSTEVDMHLFIYSQRDDVKAVVHAHPTHATGFATARIPLNECLFPEVIVGLGAIPLAHYATPSTKEVAEALMPFVGNADAILLANHGVVTYGKDLDDAYFKMEKVEHAAHIAFVARLLGGEKPLTPFEIEKLRSISETSYGKDFSQKIACEPMQELEDVSEEKLKEMIREILRK